MRIKEIRFDCIWQRDGRENDNVATDRIGDLRVGIAQFAMFMFIRYRRVVVPACRCLSSRITELQPRFGKVRKAVHQPARLRAQQRNGERRPEYQSAAQCSNP